MLALPAAVRQYSHLRPSKLLHWRTLLPRLASLLANLAVVSSNLMEKSDPPYMPPGQIEWADLCNYARVSEQSPADMNIGRAFA